MSDSTAEPEREKLEQKVINTKKKKMGCCKCMFWTLSLFVGIISCLIGGIYVWTTSYEIPEDIAINLGECGVQTFKVFDRNDDGYISISEFEPMYHHLVNGGPGGQPPNISHGEDVNYDQTIDLTDEVVSVVPSFKPLVQTSMMRDLDKHKSTMLERYAEGQRYLMGSPDPLYGLKTWKTPNKKFRNFAVRHFKPFFPPNPTYDLGQVYQFVEDEQSFFQRIVSDISSNRYFPPFVKEEYVTVHRLLSLFHPRPFIVSRFKPRGAVAVVRARNDRYLEIIFRIHAEFQLNQLPNFPFWFTPGQFTGRVIVSRDFEHIVDFNMHVPNTQKLNVDMEWLEGKSGMVVDIGYMPEMSLKVTAPSVSAKDVFLEDKLPARKFGTDIIVWTEEIGEVEAEKLLQQHMYPFMKIQYYNISTAVELAKKEDKMVHLIVLWGALDDQSC